MNTRYGISLIVFLCLPACGARAPRFETAERTDPELASMQTESPPPEVPPPLIAAPDARRTRHLLSVFFYALTEQEVDRALALMTSGAVLRKNLGGPALLAAPQIAHLMGRAREGSVSLRHVSSLRTDHSPESKSPPSAQVLAFVDGSSELRGTWQFTLKTESSKLRISEIVLPGDTR